jgi:hypothetical protein
VTENNQPKSGGGRGGRRPNSGRKPGSATKRTREIADRAAAAGVTPLEVMLEAMNKCRAAGDIEKAAGFAKDAAPYMHPRLAAVEHSGADGGPFEAKVDVRSLTDEQLVALASIPIPPN